jgi:hypothetical protein
MESGQPTDNFDVDRFISDVLSADAKGEESAESFDEESRKNNESLLTELLEVCKKHGFTVPIELGYEDGGPISELAKKFDYLPYSKGFSVLSSKVIVALHDLKLAKLCAAEGAIKARNEAIAEIFITPELSEAQKQAFIAVADEYLQGVEPFVPTTDFLTDYKAKKAVEHRNDEISEESEQQIEHFLRDKYGEHDYNHNLARAIINYAKHTFTTYIADANKGNPEADLINQLDPDIYKPRDDLEILLMFHGLNEVKIKEVFGISLAAFEEYAQDVQAIFVILGYKYIP